MEYSACNDNDSSITSPTPTSHVQRAYPMGISSPLGNVHYKGINVRSHNKQRWLTTGRRNQKLPCLVSEVRGPKYGPSEPMAPLCLVERGVGPSARSFPGRS
ncbi:hypothetical protein JTE90_022784 [Oedothorax gibbosus]|uniref:Uncharacterized protein n=1 Tax=Oedothorax gibbosus TaxID=931172 RepID=A0AAV6U9E5_9ARAC|nr:hypothetical protein JTE90_022784 [Oedothorax gibbosus]